MKIVAQSRLEARQPVRAEIAQKYAGELERAGFWRRWLVRLRIECEIRAELKRRFPPAACYALPHSGA